MDQQVAKYIEKNQAWQWDIYTDISQTIHKAAPNTTEQVKCNQVFYS